MPTATATPSPAPTTSVIPQNVRACGDDNLSISLIAGSAGPGTWWQALIGFTNISTQPCTIGGYPTLVALNQTGATVSGRANPPAFVSSSYPAGAIITLAPGQQASAEISGGKIDARGQTCPPYQWLRVTPPGGYRPWEISSFIPSFGQYAAVCGAFTVSSLYPRAAFAYSPQAIISPTTPASPAAAPCQVSQLTAHQTYMISVASQPLTIVAFYNVSTTACYLNGYVSIDAASAGTQAVPISVTHSSNYERSDPGPTGVNLPPGGAASFAIGTATAYGGGAYSTALTLLTLTPPGSRGQLQVATTTGASRPNPTGPYPLTETALVAGTNGPNS
jgi:hypothetical protein